MASTLGKSPKMRRSESKKSHSWWFDSHVGPKNKWLQGNLDDMDQNVKRMLKLIEEDAESFTKRAEMYYQKRPELIKLVEEFYRMYRSLAERYDLVTGELRKGIPSDLRSQGSGISEGSSELPSAFPSSDQRPIQRRRSGARAAGFEFFLGTGGTSSELGSREGDESSTLDSESESDNSSVISDDQILLRKINELEVELRDVKNKLKMQQEDISGLGSRDATHEEELIVVDEKHWLSEEKEVDKLKLEMLTFESAPIHGEIDVMGNILEVGKEPVIRAQDGTVAISMEGKVLELEEKLKNTKDELTKSEKEVESLRQELKLSSKSKQLLQDQLGIAQKEASSCKAKLAREEREVSKLQDRIMRYKSSLADRDQEIRRFKEAITNSNKTLSEENSQLQAEITKLQSERSYLEDNLRELDLRCQSLEEEVRRVLAGKLEMEASLAAEIQQLEEKVSEGNNLAAELTQSLDAITQDRDMLLSERNKLNEKVEELRAEMSSKDDRIVVMKQNLDQLHIEHDKLMSQTEGTHKLVEELKSRIEELEEIIQEAAEEKREVIRQLCFSLEHYRDGYQRLREALIGHRRYPVMAA